MKSILKIGSLACVFLTGVTGCKDFLTAGEVGNDPNRPVQATNRQYFVGIEANLWSIFGSDPARVTGIWAQQFFGNQSQYQSNIQSYQITEDNTNGLHAGLYGGGGLVDIKKLEAGAIAANDKRFLAVAQVAEAMLMGTGADLFGDLVYKEALAGIHNPQLDNQLTVYDSVQKLLSAAILNLQSNTATDIGPGSADLVYGGNAAQWTELAHTLKARFYFHTAEVRPTAYAAALAEVPLGIQAGDDYVGAFTSAAGEENFYYQFEVTVGRGGYVIPNPFFVTFLENRSDPRRAEYFNAAGTDLNATRLAADFQQPYVSHDENTLLWAEAAFRTSDEATALSKLNEERADNGLPPKVVAGNALLLEILSEEYIAYFQLGEEAWNLYKRTCFPNLVPTGVVPGQAIPARFFYDASERQTDTSIPQPGTGVNGARNRNDPANATSDGTGAACLGQ